MYIWQTPFQILNLQRNAAEAQREEERKMKEMEAEWLVSFFIKCEF